MHNYYTILLGVVSFIGIISPVLFKVVSYLKAKTKNEHILTAEKFAEQAITLFSDASGLTDKEVQEKAVNVLFERLNANGLKNNFTAKQLEQIVNYIYTRMEK